MPGAELDLALLAGLLAVIVLGPGRDLARPSARDRAALELAALTRAGARLSGVSAPPDAPAGAAVRREEPSQRQSLLDDDGGVGGVGGTSGSARRARATRPASAGSVSSPSTWASRKRR